MAAKKQAEPPAVLDRSIQGLPTSPAPDIGNETGNGEEAAEIAWLTAELAKRACSPKLRQFLKTTPTPAHSDELGLMRARAAIKFGIDADAWIRRALESAASKPHLIAALLDQGLQGSLPVAEAILNEIIWWDDDRSEASPGQIRRLRGWLDELFQGGSRQLAASLDAIIAANAGNARLKDTADAILGRDTPGAIALRSRWPGILADHPIKEAPPTHKTVNIIDILERLLHDLKQESIAIPPVTQNTPDSDLPNPTNEKGESGAEKIDAAISEQDWQRLFMLLFRCIPQDATFEERSRLIESIKQAFEQQMAASQGEAVKAEMLRRGQHASDYASKLDLVRWGNGEVRRHGLAFSSTKTGVGNLSADDEILDGRYSFKGKGKDENGKSAYLRATSIDSLFKELEIVKAPVRREGLAGKISKKQSKPSDSGVAR